LAPSDQARRIPENAAAFRETTELKVGLESAEISSGAILQNGFPFGEHFDMPLHAAVGFTLIWQKFGQDAPLSDHVFPDFDRYLFSLGIV
tara:strand:+ start:4555 stop:4824 length:270 start_codon:yes stop_codon:yes gene_type:complete